MSDLGYSLVVARVRAFFTEAQNHEERANMRYYKLNHPQSRTFLMSDRLLGYKTKTIKLKTEMS
jgi:hypothetical protein